MFVYLWIRFCWSKVVAKGKLSTKKMFYSQKSLHFEALYLGRWNELYINIRFIEWHSAASIDVAGSLLDNTRCRWGRAVSEKFHDALRGASCIGNDAQRIYDPQWVLVSAELMNRPFPLPSDNPGSLGLAPSGRSWGGSLGFQNLLWWLKVWSQA